MLVPKGKGYRLVGDYRRINRLYVEHQQPVPLLEDALNFVALKRSTIYSVMDLASGYFQMEIEEESRKYTGIIIPGQRIFQYRKCPFGLASAPMAFLSMIRHVLRDLEGSRTLVYMDDLLFANKTFSGLLEDMKIVFDRLLEFGLTLQN